MNHKNFDWGYFLKHIAIIAVPVALQNLLTTTGSMVDTIMLLRSVKKLWEPLVCVHSFPA